MSETISANLTASLATTSVIAPKHIFGISNNFKNHVQFINDHKVVYPAGHNIIVYNTDEKQQSYISGIEGYRGFTCFSVSPLKKFIAFAEKGDKSALFVYDTVRLAKKKQFIFPDSDGSEVSTTAFHPAQENKILVCTTSAPDLQLYCIQWSSNKILSSIKLECEGRITETAFNKKDARNVTCLGPQTFRCYQLNEGVLSLTSDHIKGLPIDNSREFTTHTWLNDGRIVVCTQKGEIFLLNSDCELITHLHDTTTNNWYIESVITYSKGFIVGGDGLTIHLYEATYDEATYYVRGTVMSSREVVDVKEARIRSLSIVDSLENKILCCTLNNNLYTVNLNSTAQLSEEYSFEPFTDSFHHGSINGMDICVRKPLVVTCSSDRSVRIWNFQENSLEYCKFFLEEAYAVSIHPSGFHVLVSFSDRIKMINIGAYNHWYEEPTQSKEYFRIKGCRVLQFSRGGQFFAAVNGNVQNNQQIQIFNTFTGESLSYPPLKGHFGRIKALAWSKDDRYLVSCGHDGMTYVWKVADGQRLYEFNSKGPSMASVALMDDNKTVLAVGNDKVIKRMTDTSIENIDSQGIFSQIALTNSNKLLFGGNSEEFPGSGYIKCYKLPLLTTPIAEHQAHDEQGVSVLKITNDDQYVASAGKDGVLVIFEVKDKEARSLKLKDGFGQYADDILITKKDIDELKSQHDALKTKMNEKKTENIPQTISDKKDAIDQLKEKQKTLRENEQLKCANLENSLKETELKYCDYIEAKKKEYEKEITDLEGHYHEITIKKVTTIEKVKKEQEQARDRYRSEISEMIKDHNNKIRGSEDEYAHLIEEEITQKNNVVADRERIKREHEEMVNQIQEEIEKEIENLDGKNSNEINNIMDKGLKSKGDVSIAKRKYEQLRKDEGELLEKEKEYLISKEELEQERQDLKENLEKQKTVINAKDDIISEKEKRIYELKKRTQELEKFKAVLDFKIKELKKDIGPREEDIAKMKIETNKLDKGLKELSTVNNTLGLVVDELDHKQSELQAHIKNQRNVMGKQATRLKEMKDDVYKTVQFILDYDALKDNVIQMKEKYANTAAKTVDIDQDILAEYLAQRKYLEKSVEMLKQNLTKDQVIHKQDNFRIMKENCRLIKEINFLRQEISNIQMGVKGSEGGKESSKSPMKAYKESMMNNSMLSEATANTLAEKKKVVDHQKHQLKHLKEKLYQLTQVTEIN